MPKQSKYDINELNRRPDRLYWSSSDCLLIQAGGILAHSKLGSFIVDTQDPQLHRRSAEQNAKELITEFCKKRKCPLFKDCMHRACGVTLKAETGFTFPAVQVF